MSSKTKKKNSLQPKLRFSEFRDADDWQQTTIGELGSFYYGKSAPKWSLSDDAPTLCVRYGELYTKFGTIISEVKSRTNTDPNTLRFSKGGEILIPRVGEKPEDFANCCYLPFPNIAIGEMISVYETKEYPIFYTYYFRTLRKQFARVVEGQNVKNLYYVNLEPIPVGKPTIPEQKKIADCLTSLDELIEAEAQKLDALKDHKKGLMQELFPAEGQTLPNRRFPEFKNAPEWEETLLGNHCKITTGKLDANAMVENGQYRFYTCAKDYYLIDKYAFDTDALLISGNGSNVGYIHHYKGKFNAYQRTYVLDKFTQDIFFIKYYLERNLHKRISTEKKDGNTPYIVMATLTDMIVTLPQDKEEQKCISDLLAASDELITAQSQKLDALRDHKKGLMQQLFPTISEVQG